LYKVSKNGAVAFMPIGKAKNSVDKPMLAGWNKVVTEIVVDKKFSKGLDGIEDYSHVIVVYLMDKEKECHLKHHPQNRSDVPYVGIYACRCPQRPNPIAISTVKLVKRKSNVLFVKGLDILNDTPILDLKPYTPAYDLAAGAKVPSWIKKLVF